MDNRSLFAFTRGEKRAILILVIMIAGVLLWKYILYREENHFICVAPTFPKDTVFVVQKQEIMVTKPPVPISVNSFDSSSQSSKTYTQPSSLSKEEKPQLSSFSSQVPFYKSNKYPEGTVLNLNRADTTELQKIPGIGPSFSSRIVKYRTLLGGFYQVEQLREVYGITSEKYEALSPWFKVESNDSIVKLPLNDADFSTLNKHPYLSYKQVQILLNHRNKKGRLTTLDDFRLYEEFGDSLVNRLIPYVVL